LDIETVAEKTPEKIIKVPVDPGNRLPRISLGARELVFGLGITR